MSAKPSLTVGFIDDDHEDYWARGLRIATSLKSGGTSPTVWTRHFKDLLKAEMTGDNKDEWMADAFVVDAINHDRTDKDKSNGANAMSKLARTFPGSLFVICSRFMPDRDAIVREMVESFPFAVYMNKLVPDADLISSSASASKKRVLDPKAFIPLQLEVLLRRCLPLAGFVRDYVHAVPIQPLIKGRDDDMARLIAAVNLNDAGIAQRIAEVGKRSIGKRERWSWLLFARNGRAAVTTNGMYQLLKDALEDSRVKYSEDVSPIQGWRCRTIEIGDDVTSLECKGEHTEVRGSYKQSGLLSRLGELLPGSLGTSGEEVFSLKMDGVAFEGKGKSRRAMKHSYELRDLTRRFPRRYVFHEPAMLET